VSEIEYPFTGPELFTDRLTVQGALEWLEKNQDTSLDELQAAEASSSAADDGPDAGASAEGAKEGEGAKSLVCNECGKKFRNSDLASYHASKT
jgi:UBX domain-containing protein 1/4